MTHLKARMAAIVATGLTIAGCLTAAPAAASAQATKSNCTPLVCLMVWHTGTYVTKATVYLQDIHTNVAFDYHYFGPAGTPDRWARNVLCNGTCAWQFTNINTTYQSGRLVCGESYSNGRLLGRPCVTM